jgi:tetratricopeptide (TPR) repeat protein
VRGWGSVARRGVRRLDEPREGSASDAWQDAERRSRGRDQSDEDIWIDEGVVRDQASEAVARGARPTGAPARARDDGREREAPGEIVDALSKAVGPVRGKRLGGRLVDASRAYERERFQDARRMLRVLAEEAPGVAVVRELNGLTLYRLGDYRGAARELEAYHDLTHEVDEHHVLADCYRAMKRWARVEETWRELREASPSAELVAEGRIVMAGALADQGDLQGAIRVMQQGPLVTRRPQEHHLRMWYVLADLYERAGDVPRAREFFQRIVAVERNFADARDRIRSLS